VDFNTFLYYGQAPLEDEVRSDVAAGILQDRRSMFYHRSYGAGLSEYENAPDGIALQVGLKYRAADWLARRNLEVSDGSNGTRDRRVATSQGAMSVEREGGGLILRVLYVLYADASAGRVLAVSPGM
jgi:hypothetical protein